MDFEPKPIPQQINKGNEAQPKLSRRKFLELAGGGAVFLVLSSCGVKPTPESESPPTETAAPTETAESKRFVPREKITELDDLLRCTDKKHAVPIEDMLHGIRKRAKYIGYIGYPNEFQFGVADRLS